MLYVLGYPWASGTDLTIGLQKVAKKPISELVFQNRLFRIFFKKTVFLIDFLKKTVFLIDFLKKTVLLIDFLKKTVLLIDFLKKAS